MFKKEYRHFGKLKTIGIKLPTGYNILQSKILEYRTKGTGGRRRRRD